MRRCPPPRNVVVIGAGFIGLEFAAAARAHGCNTTVLEFAPRPMGRALTPVMGDWFAGAHERLGIKLKLSEGIDSFEAGEHGRVATAVSTTGARYPADLVVVGIGVLPNDSLALEAGLETGNGILVDERCAPRTRPSWRSGTARISPIRAPGAASASNRCRTPPTRPAM